MVSRPCCWSEPWCAPALALALSLCACGFSDEYEGLPSGRVPTAEDSGSSSETNSVDSGTTLDPATSTAAGTTASSAGTSGSASESGNAELGTGGEATAGDAVACGLDWHSKDPSVPSIMDGWGAPCATDADCKQLLGLDDAMCVQTILDAYEFPGGYCSRPCSLPSLEVSFVANDPACDPAGGVDCVGTKRFFEACVRPCTSHDVCGRMGYACVSVPIISKAGDPLYCLMNEDSCCTPSVCPEG